MTRIAAARPLDPEPAENPRVVVGSNRPPIDQLARADFDEAIDSHAGLRKRITDLVDSSTRATATNDETAGRCAELIRQMSAVEKVVTDERVKVKAPYLAAGRQIDDAAKSLLAKLTEAKDSVRDIANAYLREQQRKADEERRRQEAEALRQRQEAEARRRAEEERAAAENRAPEPVEEPVIAPPPPPAEPVRVRSDFGAVASARKVKVATITDWPKAFKAVKTVPAVQEAVQKAINALVRAGQTGIAGVEITEDVGLSVR